jgi:uncharacterized membrane protein
VRLVMVPVGFSEVDVLGVIVRFYFILTHFNTGSISLLWFFYNVVKRHVLRWYGVDYWKMEGTHGRIGLTSFFVAYVPN